MKYILIFIIYFSNDLGYSQTAIGGIDPNQYAQLDVIESKKGILIPRVALQSLTSALPISENSGDLPISLLVFNTNNTADLDRAYYYWNGTHWNKIRSQEDAYFGDVKQGFQSKDHGGWIKLDARAISELTPTQKLQAMALGFTSHLPDATDKVLKQKQTLNITGGNNAVVIAKANIPNYTLPSATTSTNGAHTHTYQKSDYCSRCLTYTNVFWATSTNRGFESQTTSSSGNHTHTVTVHSGGSGSPLNVENQYLSVNTFVYLGK